MEEYRKLVRIYAFWQAGHKTELQLHLLQHLIMTSRGQSPLQLMANRGVQGPKEGAQGPRLFFLFAFMVFIYNIILKLL